MDKYEYRVKTEQMLEHMEKKQYKKAMEIADTVDWRRVKNASMLNSVSEIYEYNGEFQKSRDILFVAFDRSPGSRKIVYRLGTLALKINDIDEASDCYEEFVKIAPKDPNQYIIKYKILKAQKAPLSEQISALEDFKKAEYVEKWAYELALLYHEAGMTTECLEECDDLILWFSEGKYVFKAMELKMKYRPLTPLQQEKYDNRDGAVRQPVREPNPQVKAAEAEQESARKRAEIEALMNETIKMTFPPQEEAAADTAEEAEEDEIPLDATKEIPTEELEKLHRARMAQREDSIDNTDNTEAEEKELKKPQERMDRSPAPSISKIVKGATLEEALVNGVKIANGIEIEEKAMAEKTEELRITGQMKIEEILQEWESKQKTNAQAIEKQKAEDDERIRKERERAVERREAERLEVERKAAEAAKRAAAEEAARKAAEEEAARKAAEEEAARIAAEEEAARKAAEEEAAKLEAILDPVEEKPEEAAQTVTGMTEDIRSLMEELEEDIEPFDVEEELEVTKQQEDSEPDFEDTDDFEDEIIEDEEYEEDFDETPEEVLEDSEYEDVDEYEEDFEEVPDEEDFDEDDIEAVDFEEDFAEEEFEEDDFEEDYEEDFDEEDFEEDFEEDDVDEEAFDDEEQEELVIEEPSEEEIQKRIKRSKGGGVPFDTGFVVTGRYDLSATSEIGLKAGLTEEQKKLFSYFVPVRGMSEQIVEVLDNDRRVQREGTSKTGNIMVIGRQGSGKTVLAVDIVKAIQKQRNLKQGKVAIVTGESLNKKEISNIIQKLRGGAIIIEKAGKLNSRTVKELDQLMEKKTGELLFVLEDQRKPLERIFTAHPEFKKKFSSRLELPTFINDELVTFGQTYAKENGYKLDEMGILALYSRIDVMQREDHAVTVAEVKEIMDEAIGHSQKANVKHLARRVFGKSTDDSDRIILKEEDFRI